MRVAIMQPTYLPWSGYFGLMQSVDVFVFLDSVQFARRSWQQRNQIKTSNGPLWLTVPVISKGKRDQLISEVELDRSRDFAATHIKSIEASYSKAPFFNILAPKIFSFLDDRNPCLADLTIGIILHCANLLKLETKTILSSSLDCHGSKADLLASICHKIGATEYISVQGSKDYLEESDAFKKIGLPVHYFNYNHPQHSQLHGDFLSNMAVIDMLFNCGDSSSNLIKSGVSIL